jgi:hypothetical protein
VVSQPPRFSISLASARASRSPREFTTDTASYGTSDVITYWEAALSLALTVLAGGVGWALSPTVEPERVTPRVSDKVERTPS